MKNRIVCALLCGLICLTGVGVTTPVQAAPTAGVISVISGETGSVEKKSGTVRTGAAEILETEIETESAHTAGITQTLASNLSEAEIVAVKETEASQNEIAGEMATAAAEDAAAEADASTAEAAGAAEGTKAAEEGTAEAQETPEQNEFSNIGIATVTDYVNVRSEASAESEAVGKLYTNNAVEVVGKNEDGTWLEIVSGDLRGFVSAEFVSVGDPELIKQASHRVATVHTETLFVRALPTQDSEVVEMVPDQEQLTVIDEQYVDNWGWVGVSVEEGAGYVSMEFVDLSTEYTYGETKEHEEARLAREEEERRAAEAAAAQSNASSKSSAQSASSSSSSGSTSGSGYVATGGGNGSSVANYALQFVGNPYVYGGSSLTNGTDCSGFVMSVYANYGVGLPHSSSALRSVGYGVDPAAMQPGDIVCYSGHVGIAIGGGQIVHASTPATGIKVSNAFYRDILAVRRIF